MMNRFTILFVVPLIFAAPSPALADAFANVVFDTVDGVELDQATHHETGVFVLHTVVVVTGIRKGQSTPVTLSFDFGDKVDVAAHCQRLAMVAMSKQGKYRFGIGVDTAFGGGNTGKGACSLTLVTP